MTLPNFFIVGAPKCGTTAIYSYLRQHPEVWMSDPKEPHYFGSDLEFRYRHRPSEATYRALFEPGRGRARLGEASVWYLYSTRAAEEIHQVVPDARIVAMVRDPVAMIASLHSQLAYNGHEDLPLEEALAAEADRAAGRRIPEHVNLPKALLYRRVAAYAEQIERYLDRFGPERVHVIVHDDLRSDPAAVYHDLLRFLAIDESHRPDFALVNPNKRSRSMLARRFLNDPPPWLRSLGRRLLPARLRRNAYRTMVRANTDYVARDALDPPAANRLREEMAPEVLRLGRLLGRDLSAWLPHR
jgi:hypothetical protein